MTTEITRNVDEMSLGTCERYRVTSVVISHDMASVFRIADRYELLRASGVSAVQKAAGGHA